MYKYKNEERLCPPAYTPTESEIKLAKAKYVMENRMWETIHYLTMYYNMSKGEELHFPYTKEIVEQNAKQTIEQWNKSMAKWDDNMEIWDALIDPEWFKTVYIDGLSDIHSGDCTAFACSCMRCHAEEMFGVPGTANWGKHEGWKLWNEYSADVDRQKKEKEDQVKKGE
jgi:hypothetical protein